MPAPRFSSAARVDDAVLKQALATDRYEARALKLRMLATRQFDGILEAGLQPVAAHRGYKGFSRTNPRYPTIFRAWCRSPESHPRRASPPRRRCTTSPNEPDSCRRPASRNELGGGGHTILANQPDSCRRPLRQTNPTAGIAQVRQTDPTCRMGKSAAATLASMRDLSRLRRRGSGASIKTRRRQAQRSHAWRRAASAWVKSRRGLVCGSGVGDFARPQSIAKRRRPICASPSLAMRAWRSRDPPAIPTCIPCLAAG